MKWWTKITSFFTSLKNRLLRLIDRHPFPAFIGGLVALLVVIIVAHQLRQTPPDAVAEPEPPTPVQVYQNGTSPTITATAKIEKSGVITIMAQTGGIVQKVPVTEGQHVKRGTTLVSLSTNYQGGNIATVNRQIAQRNAQFNADTYDLEKQIIAQKRETANKAETQSSELREIGRASQNSTRDLIKLNEEIISGLNTQIADLESINVNGASDSAILQIKQGKAQVESGLLTLRSSLRSSEYNNSDDQEPAQLDRLDKEITLKQLDLQEKSLDLTKDLGNLQVKLARVSEALMYPTTPCPGVVERVFVKVGQTVTPGTPLAVIRADAREITAVVHVPGQVAQRISRAEQSTFTVNGQTFAVAPRYISAEPVDGTLHAVLYSIPGEYESYFSNGEQIAVTLPLGATMISNAETFIPLDAVYQTQEAAFVYVAEQVAGELHAKVRQVELGAVSGSYVKVTAGLTDSDQVIITRGMSDGERVTIQ